MPKHKEMEYTRDAPKSKIIGGKRYQYQGVTLTKRGALKRLKKLKEEGYSARALKWGPGMGFYAIYIREKQEPNKIRISSRTQLLKRKAPRITPQTPRLRR